jgi:hypothetical protein
MIPMVPKGALSNNPERSRRVLFILGAWEIVLYKDRTKAYAVHSCNGERSDFRGHATNHPPRAVTQASVMAKSRITSIACWSCDADVPEEIITITELFNA